MRFRASIQLMAAVVFFALADVAPAVGADTPFRFDGTWHVTRIVGYSDVPESPAKLRLFIGKKVTIGPSRLRRGDDDCAPDAMHSSTRATAPLLLETYHAGPTDAGVAARTEVLEAGQCGYVFRAGADIVVYQGGAFYRAVRDRPAHNRP